MVTISFLGDISLNDDYIKLHKEGAEPFADLAGYLQKSDLVVGNLECVSAGEKGENTFRKPRLKTETETLGYLKHINLGIACLAHNHVYDNLEDGLRRTTTFLNQNEIQFIGASPDHPESVSTLKIEIKGTRFAFLNYVSRDTNPGLPPDAEIQLSVLEKSRVLSDLAKVKDEDYRVLILHWGGRYENSYYPGPDQIKLARDFIRAGADLIIGHHSHTLQPQYHFRKKSVFFSLGNFCFADVHSDGKVKEIKYKRWKESAILNVNFEGDKYHTHLLHFRVEKLHTLRDRTLTLKYQIRKQFFKLMLVTRLFWYFYYFGFKYIRPVVWELRKQDPDRNFLKRIFGLNRAKIRGMFK